jgi:hypothetical protein
MAQLFNVFKMKFKDKWLTRKHLAPLWWWSHIEHHHIMMPFACDAMRQSSCVLVPPPGCGFGNPAAHWCLEWGSVGISCVGRLASSALILSEGCCHQSHYLFLFIGICMHLHHSILFLCCGVSMSASFAPWFEYFVNPTCDHWGGGGGWDFMAGYKLMLLSQQCVGVVKFLVQELSFLAYGVFDHKPLQT